MIIALPGFIPFSIPIENKKRKPVSASNRHKYNQNLLKNRKIDPKSSLKQKRFGQSVVVSPFMKNSKMKSIFEPIKTKNNENYNDGNNKNGSKNNRSKSRSEPFKKEINFLQSHANSTFANPFFHSSNFVTHGNLNEKSKHIQRANNYYVHSFNNIDDLHKTRLQTSSTASKDNKKFTQINNYTKESRYAIATKKSISPPNKSIF